LQKFLRDQIRLNHNETIIPSSLDAMRDQYEDLLADFRCEGREIFHVVFNRTDSHPSQSKQTDAAMFSYIYIYIYLNAISVAMLSHFCCLPKAK